MNKDQILKDIYYDPETGLSSVRQLYLKVKNNGITYNEVKE
jgi:hypothetical protein